MFNILSIEKNFNVQEILNHQIKELNNFKF
jgi:hypothetical protein